MRVFLNLKWKVELQWFSTFLMVDSNWKLPKLIIFNWSFQIRFSNYLFSRVIIVSQTNSFLPTDVNELLVEDFSTAELFVFGATGKELNGILFQNLIKSIAFKDKTVTEWLPYWRIILHSWWKINPEKLICFTKYFSKLRHFVHLCFDQYTQFLPVPYNPRLWFFYAPTSHNIKNI